MAGCKELLPHPSPLLTDALLSTDSCTVLEAGLRIFGRGGPIVSPENLLAWISRVLDQGELEIAGAVEVAVVSRDPPLVAHVARWISRRRQ